MNDSSPPQQVAGRYRLTAHLGRGGMASVYRAHDEMLGRDVAIKFLMPKQTLDATSSERFLREARSVARLSHPNIMALFDMGREGNWHYLVLEYIPGKNLHQLLTERDGAFPLHEALNIIILALKALAYAHGQNLIHRDIKPENIMITHDGHVKVTDFGLAMVKDDVRLTREDVVVGTALYMAPETFTTGKFDQRADLYAIGAVFYELLTGQPPYQGENSLKILTRALNEPLTPPGLINPDIPEHVEQVILRLLAKNPDERFRSADETLAALPKSSEIDALIADEIKRATSERLSLTLLERIVRGSSTTHTRPLDDEDDDPGDSLLNFLSTGEPQPLAQQLLVYAAQEDTIEAVEAERRRMARDLEESVISQLNLMLSQASAYEQTISGNPQARMALSVLSSLIRQVLQQTRDLEASLHPAILESLGLEPALESLASQEMRSRGLHVLLSLQRMRERLPPQIELALFRVTQDAIDRATRQAHASQITIRLERQDDAIVFSVADNGLAPSGEVLRTTRQRIEGLGGEIVFRSSADSGLAVHIRFAIEAQIDLTERELDVIQLLAEGLTNREIAALLFVSPRTVKFHLDNIYSKLGVSTRTEAAIYALRRGWVRQKPSGIT